MCKRTVYFGLVLALALASIAGAADASLVLSLKLDETAGSVATDSSGLGNDGTIVGTANWVEGKFGGALEFDGVGNRIEIAHNESLDITESITIEAWLYPRSTATFQFLSKGDTGGRTWGTTYSIAMFAGGIIQFHNHSKETGTGLAATTGIIANEWSHIALTFDLATEGNNQKYYLNGVVDVENRNDLPLKSNTEAILIGSDNYQGGRWYWPGLMDSIHIYSRALSESEIHLLMATGELSPETLAVPLSPAGDASNVLRDGTDLVWSEGSDAVQYDVYFGDDFDDVNAATTDSDTYKGRQSEMVYSLDRLDFGQDYYWRIDAVNDANANSPWIGTVKKFTVEPEGYPVDQITVTASSENLSNPQELQPAINTINGSGLDADGGHSQKPADMWITMIDPNEIWIQFDFAQAAKLSSMKIWNHNTTMESILGLGIREALIEISADGVEFVALEEKSELLQAPAVTVFDMAGMAVKAVRITSLSSYGSFINQCGLSEVQFLAIPVLPTKLSPANGTANVGVESTEFSWRLGRGVDVHDVYLSTDEQAVIDSTADVVTVNESSYVTDLDLNATYFWKVVEVNETDQQAWASPVQSFSTIKTLSIDDMESYKDQYTAQEGEMIFDTWSDGYENSQNGALLGHNYGNDPEIAIAYEGKQSIPYYYGQDSIANSEATLLGLALDASKHGINSLILYVNGAIDNVAGQLYVKINNGAKINYVGPTSDLTSGQWMPSVIDLSNVSVLTSLIIGVDGGSGVFYMDAITLTNKVQEVITPVAPSDEGLKLYYSFDDGTATDLSGSGVNGVIVGDVVFEDEAGRGKVAVFDGADDAIDVNEVVGIYPEITIAMWVNLPTENLPARIWDNTYGADGWDANDVHFRVRQAKVSAGCFGLPGIAGKSKVQTATWTHVAYSVARTETDYIISGWLNGVCDVQLISPINTDPNVAPIEFEIGDMHLGGWMNGGAISREFLGKMDDVKVYNRALNAGEIAGLAGRTGSTYK